MNDANNANDIILINLMLLIIILTNVMILIIR